MEREPATALSDVDMDRKVFPVSEVKQLGEEEEGTIEAVVAVFGNEDLGGDVIHRGAFTKTIQERVPRGMVPFLDTHALSGRSTHGTVVAAEETPEGLRVRVKLASDPDTQALKTKMLEGHLSRFSIGFDAVTEEFRNEGGRMTRHLRELKLFEVSVTPLAMNEATRLIAVKSAVRYQDLPLAGRRRAWDADGALARIRSWAGGPAADDVNFTRYRRAFLWWDTEDPEQLGSYKLPIADVVDGRLTAIPRGIFAAAAVLEGGRGGVEIPDGDRPAIRRHLARYYRKMREAFEDDSLVAPWERRSLDTLLAEAEAGLVEPEEAKRLAAHEIASVLGDDSAGPGPTPPTERKEEASPSAARARAEALRTYLAPKFGG